MLLALEVVTPFPNLDNVQCVYMNGKYLTANHGYPLQVMVPGVSGCRSVRWLDRITVQSEESSELYQQHDYNVLPPEPIDRESASKYWDTTPALQDMSINFVIVEHQTVETIKLSPSATIETKGYALPHGDQGPVVKSGSLDERRTNMDRSWDYGHRQRQKQMVLGTVEGHNSDQKRRPATYLLESSDRRRWQQIEWYGNLEPSRRCL